MTIPPAAEGGADGVDPVDGSHGGGGPHHRHLQQHAYHGQHYQHYHHGKRTLQRAANLLTSRGQPRPELKASLLEMSAAARGAAVAIVAVRGGERTEGAGENAREGVREGEGEGRGHGVDVRGHGRSRSEGSAGVRRLSSLKRTLMSVKEGASASLASGVQTVARSKSWRFSGSKASSGGQEEQHARGGQKRKGHARSMSDAPPPRPRLVFSPDGSDRAFASNSNSIHGTGSTDVVHPAHILRKASTRASMSSQMSTQMSPVVESPSEAHARAAGTVAQPASIADVAVPQLLQQGTPMIKVSAKKQKRVVFRLDPDQGQIIWEGKKHRISASLSLSFRFPVLFSTRRLLTASMRVSAVQFLSRTSRSSALGPMRATTANSSSSRRTTRVAG